MPAHFARPLLQNRMALVTGASAGIGEAFARLLASQGAGLLLVARREERLQKLAQELSAQYGVRAECYTADLARPEAPAAIVAEAERRGFPVDVLVNNAGFASGKTFADSEWPALHAEIQVMITAVTELSHRLTPGMKSRRYGRIINLASIASFLPAVSSLLYTGVKSFVLNMSEALDMELKPHGIHVTALCPGLTRSEFHDVQGTRWLMDRVPGFMWQDADQVAREGLAAVMAGRPVCVPGTINKAITFTSRLLPERLRYEAGRVAQVVK